MMKILKMKPEVAPSHTASLLIEPPSPFDAPSRIHRRDSETAPTPLNVNGHGTARSNLNGFAGRGTVFLVGARLMMLKLPHSLLHRLGAWALGSRRRPRPAFF